MSSEGSTPYRDDRIKVLFLFTELTGYFTNCVQLLKDSLQAEIRVVYCLKMANAPFEHNLEDIEVVDKNSISKDELMQNCLVMQPSIVYVSGWVNKDYKIIARSLKRKGSIVVSGLDNAWTGSLRQRFACLFTNILIKPYYSFLWVAGHRQYQFAWHLGYSYEYILTGLYAADIKKFGSIANHPMDKYLVYVGRFETIKGVQILYDVFSSLSDEERNGWKLKMIGNGSMRDQLKSKNNIEVYDYMQPDKLVEFVSGAGGFILPSLVEPWGVVVQEFAAAGKPLLLSKAVNSGEDFLINNFNGYSFKSGDAEDLKLTLLKFFRLRNEDRELMGKRSAEIALFGEPKYWVAKLVSLLPEKENVFKI